MRKLIFTLSLSCILVSMISAQEQVGDIIPLADVPESVSLVKQANDYASAVVNKDFNSIIGFTHNDVVEMGGGAEFMVTDLESQSLNLENQGLKYVSAEVGSHPEFLESSEELQTIIPVKFQMNMGDKKVESWTNLFAVSKDEGINWKFVNLEMFDEASLREFVKNVSSDLVYPK